VIYTCDEYYADEGATQAQRPASGFKILDIQEVDWCDYVIKVTTKYMCHAGSSLPKPAIKKEQLMKNQ